MSPIDILATIFAVAVLVKLFVVVVNIRAWMKFVEPVYKHPHITAAVYLVLLALAAYYARPFISAAEFGSVMFMAALLIGLGFLPYAKSVMHLREEVAREGLAKAWLAVGVWLLLALAILYGVFN